MEVKLLVEGVQCDDAWERTEDKQATCKESSERQAFYRKWKSLLIQVRKFRDNKKVNHVVLVIDVCVFFFFFPLPLHQAYRASRILFSLYLHTYFYEVESETSERVPWSGDYRSRYSLRLPEDTHNSSNSELRILSNAEYFFILQDGGCMINIFQSYLERETKGWVILEIRIVYVSPIDCDVCS